MDGCVLLTSTPECVVSPRGETTHSGVDVNNTHPSMINPLTNPSFAVMVWLLFLSLFQQSGTKPNLVAKILATKIGNLSALATKISRQN